MEGEMTTNSLAIQIGIYRRDPEANWNVNEVEVGSLLNQLIEEPFHFAKVGEDGSIQVEVQRTHEWEIVVGLALIGSGIFLKGALTELGKRFGGWLADRMGKLRTQQNPEVRSQGATTVVVNPLALNEASAAITTLVANAAQAGTRVLLIVEPGK
jgi:hypothetical protein